MSKQHRYAQVELFSKLLGPKTKCGFNVVCKIFGIGDDVIFEANALHGGYRSSWTF